MHELAIEDAAADVVQAAYDIRQALGAGLYESVYKTLLVHRLRRAGHVVECEKPIPLVFEGIEFKIAGRADLLVDGQLVVETKAVAALHPIHHAQTLTYMRLLRAPLGLLVNFNAVPLRDGIRRFAGERRRE